MVTESAEKLKDDSDEDDTKAVKPENIDIKTESKVELAKADSESPLKK